MNNTLIVLICMAAYSIGCLRGYDLGVESIAFTTEEVKEMRKQWTHDIINVCTGIEEAKKE